MAKIFSGKGCKPCTSILCPKYSIQGSRNLHLSILDVDQLLLDMLEHPL